MDETAVDIVLLPPPNIMKQVISLLPESRNPSTSLNGKDCLPHISLAMGVIHSRDVASLQSEINELAAESNITITLAETRQQMAPDGRLIADIKIINSSELTQLHEQAKKILKSLSTSSEPTTSMFFQPPEVAEVSVTWVKSYATERFDPHITLGEGTPLDLHEPVVFQPERLAVCHLGTYCTCRKVLVESSISGNSSRS